MAVLREKPVSVSVAVKQASKMLVLFWSRCLFFFTAIITNALSTTIKGQVMPLMIIAMMLTSYATFRVPPCTVVSVTLTFVKFDPDSLAIFRKCSEDKLTLMDFYMLFFLY